MRLGIGLTLTRRRGGGLAIGAPVAGSLIDQVFVLDTGDRTYNAAPNFTVENDIPLASVTWYITGPDPVFENGVVEDGVADADLPAGVSISSGGLVTIETDAAISDTLTVWAVNSAGFDSADFALTVTNLIDTLSTAPAAAFGLRKLRAAYAASAIRVRRTSDSTEQNIGFTSNGLDTSALATFCAGTDGYVTIWYDQTANARNLLQTTAGNQMRIVLAGVLDVTANGKPKMLTPDATGRGYKATISPAYTGTGIGGAWCGTMSPATLTFGRGISVQDVTNDSSNQGGAVLVGRNNAAAAVNTQRNNVTPSVCAITNGALMALGARFGGNFSRIESSLASDADAYADAAFNVQLLLNGYNTSSAFRTAAGHEQCEAIYWFADPGATNMTTTLASQRAFYGAA